MLEFNQEGLLTFRGMIRSRIWARLSYNSKVIHKVQMFVCLQECTLQQTSQQAEADNHEGGPCQSFYYAQFAFIQHSPWLAFAQDQPVLAMGSAAADDIR